jgi:hypothetical protein
MSNPKEVTIEEHWDTGQEIFGDSDPEQEFEKWKKNSSPLFDGDEFDLEDFEIYISKLKEAEMRLDYPGADKKISKDEEEVEAELLKAARSQCCGGECGCTD